MTTLALIDFGSLFGERYHANRENAAAASNEVLAYIRGKLHSYDVVAVCIDRPPYKRSEVFPAYKASREPWPAGAKQVREDTVAEVRKLCHVLEAEGYEADDCIATAVLNTYADATVYSADKDLAQLMVWDTVRVCRLNGNERDLSADRGWEGIAPEQVCDFLALIGDKSDNLPGIDGVGPKRAAALLEAFGDLSGIEGAPLELLAGVVGPKLANAVKLAFDAPPGETPHDIRDLILLDCDAPCDCSVLTIPTRPKETDMSDDDIPQPEDTQPSQPQPTIIDAEPVSSQPRPVVQALARREVVEFRRELEPSTIEMAWKVAVKLHESGLYKIRNPQGAFAILMEGRSFGLGAAESVRGIEIIDGKPSMKSSLIQALCEASPKCEYFMVTELSNERVTMETKKHGQPKPQSVTWTMEDAQRAGLTGKQNWQKYPRAMLLARCRAELGRMVYPEVTHNVYSPDELGVAIEDPEAA